MKIGFIGVGIMGKEMVRNLVKSGFEVAVYTRTKSKIEDLLSEGVTWANSVKECSENKDAIITIVGYPKDVEEVYFGENGILKSAKSGAYVIDMTTSSPKLALKIYEEAKKLGIYSLDAPISGGDKGAREGTLSIMVGGDKNAFEDCQPIFSAMGKTICYQGSASSGQHTKAANQIAIAGCLAGVCEALAYSKKVGLNQNQVIDIIKGGAGGSWQMVNNAPKIANGDFSPAFYLKHYLKDLNIGVSEAESMGLLIEITTKVRDIFEELSKDGFDDNGIQVLSKHYE